MYIYCIIVRRREGERGLISHPGKSEGERDRDKGETPTSRNHGYRPCSRRTQGGAQAEDEPQVQQRVPRTPCAALPGEEGRKCPRDEVSEGCPVRRTKGLKRKGWAGPSADAVDFRPACLPACYACDARYSFWRGAQTRSSSRLCCSACTCPRPTVPL